MPKIHVLRWLGIPVFGAAVWAAPMARAQDLRAALLQAEAAACHAFEAGDATFLRKALTPDFTLVDSRGNVTDLAQNLAEVAAREPYYDEFRNDGQSVRMYGEDTALIVGITHIRGKAGGEAFAADFRYTDTWIRRDGRWLLAASHASRLPDAAAAP
jgi:ketosteroid isomerase-like protein